MIREIFDGLVKNMKVIYGNLGKIETGQGIDYTAKFLLDYLYFEEHWKIIAKSKL